MNNVAQVFSYSLQPIIKAVRNWWLTRLENHYLMSAATEAERAKEALANVKYYQRKAAFARSNRSN